MKKANRDLQTYLSSIPPPSHLDTVIKKYSELFAEMKKLERESSKNKKRADQVQKEFDKAKADHTKTTSLKDKLEKLSRELTREQKKLKVRTIHNSL